MTFASNASRAIALSIIVLATCLRPVAAADPFYKGKTISLIIASNVTGGYDGYGRLLARHLGRHLAGTPNIVPQNMPGAVGGRAAGYLYNVAAQDGTVIGIFDQAMFLRQLLEVPGFAGDVTRFNWIGRLVSNSAVLFAWHTAKVQKIEDAFTNELIVATGGAASRLNWTALNALAGTRFRLITGYKSAADAKIAMLRGEIEALSLPWSAIRSESAELLRDKKINLLLQTGNKNRGLEHLPRMVDLAKSDEARKVLEVFASPSVIGRAFVAPPEVPPERMAELREAFSAMLKDPELLADAAKINFDLDPLPGLELQAFFKSAVYPPALIARAKEIAKQAGY